MSKYTAEQVEAASREAPDYHEIDGMLRAYAADLDDGLKLGVVAEAPTHGRRT